MCHLKVRFFFFKGKEQQEHNRRSNVRKFKTLYLDSGVKKMQRESEKSLSVEKWDLSAAVNSPPAKDKQGPRQDGEKTDETVTDCRATELILG